jgi:hypothetical protein
MTEHGAEHWFLMRQHASVKSDRDLPVRPFIITHSGEEQ